MLPNPTLLTIITACAIASGAAAPAGQPDKQPPTSPQKDQHFCCQQVDPKTLTGEGCITIGPNQIDSCAEVLYCEGSWTKHDGKVTCS